MGARSDRTQDPEIIAALLLARRGQAFFSRKLAELRDAELDEPSLLSGWTRRHVIAHVGLNARALTRLTEWAATGVETPMYDSPEARDAEIEFAATLPTRALRHLSAHAAVHLDVEWRDLDPGAWEAVVRTAQGREVPATETIWMRTREVWIHAVDLDNGATFRQFPPELVDGLLTDVERVWHRKHSGPIPVLEPTDRPARTREPAADGAPRVRGRAADLARWATGRGGVAPLERVGGGPVPDVLSWL
ncbi:MAG: maleylpyruvate isomerase family mycothiol-dependent enzyme [Actinomycetales bacterium]|nr:maleylpyruvate isomerase family mycothiol-dependent enzyme [Actinomycetales bacterium]